MSEAKKTYHPVKLLKKVKFISLFANLQLCLNN